MVANPKYYYKCPNSEQRHTVAYIWTELRITTEQCVSNKEFRINVHPSIFLNKSRYEIIHSALTVCQNSDYNTAAVGSNTMHLFRFMLMYLLYPEEFYRITQLKILSPVRWKHLPLLRTCFYHVVIVNEELAHDLAGQITSIEKMKTTITKTQPSRSNRNGFSLNAEFNYPKTPGYPECLVLKNEGNQIFHKLKVFTSYEVSSCHSIETIQVSTASGSFLKCFEVNKFYMFSLIFCSPNVKNKGLMRLVVQSMLSIYIQQVMA